MVLCHCVGRSITTAVLQPRLTTISLSVASLHVWHARIVKGLVVCSFRDAQFFLFSSLNDTGPCCSDLCGPPRLDRPCGIDGEPTEQLRLLVGRGIIFLTFGAHDALRENGFLHLPRPLNNTTFRSHSTTTSTRHVSGNSPRAQTKLVRVGHCLQPPHCIERILRCRWHRLLLLSLSRAKVWKARVTTMDNLNTHWKEV